MIDILAMIATFCAFVLSSYFFFEIIRLVNGFKIGLSLMWIAMAIISADRCIHHIVLMVFPEMYPISFWENILLLFAWIIADIGLIYSYLHLRKQK